MGWEEVEIGEALSKVRRAGKLKKSDYLQSGQYPVIDQGEGQVAGYSDDQSIVHTAPLPITIFGDHTRRVKLATEPFVCGADGTQLLYPKSSNIDPTYFYYAIKAVDLSNFHYARHFKFLKKLTIKYPSLPIQRRIARILSAYDDLIEVNTRRIKALEEMAHRTYEEWFVTRVLPDWPSQPLKEISSEITRGLAPKYNENGFSVVINQRCIRDFQLSLQNSRRQEKAIAEKKRVQENDVLINSTGVGTLGRVAQVSTSFDGLTVDTHVTIVRPSELVDPNFFGAALFYLQPTFQDMGDGSTGQTELSRTRIGETLISVPPLEMQIRYGSFRKKVRVAIENLIKQNTNLRAQRDLLLPRLVSGAIDVSDAETTLPKADVVAAE